MDYDVAIIGGGPAGYPLALCCQKYGMKVLIIEKEPHLGGVCLHMGCIPSKTLLHATEYGHVVPKELMQSKERVIGTLSQGLDMLFAAKKIDRMTGAAIVTGAHEIEVQTQQATKRVTAKTIVLATGSRPIEIPGLPFDEKRIVSSTGALHIEKVPDTLVVIGAGVIGVELASVYRRLGSKVSIIELLPTLCQGFDASIQNGLLQSLQEMGIEFFFNTKVVSAEMKKNRLCVSATTVSKPLELMADKILVAVGRRPNSQGLGLEELGIAILPSGHVQTNASFCTTVPSIYAIGDLTRGAHACPSGNS